MDVFMPELPEVQTIVNDLIDTGLTEARIQSVRVSWPRSIASMSPQKFSRKLDNVCIQRIWRRAKYIIFDLNKGNGSLLIHLRMSGRLRITNTQEHRDKHDHVCIAFSDGRELRLHDTRKFARLYLCKTAEEIIGTLGPEPLEPDFKIRDFKTMLKSRARMLKPLLLDQHSIAGLGNIYVDEALWEAGLHPCRKSGTLSQGECKKLFAAIPRVLKRGLRNLGTTLGTGKANFFSIAGRKGENSSQLRVFRRTGLPCPRCGQSIERIIISQRSTHICPACQV
jgi:formamidopyrimidine-DNA glycosylase